MTVHPGATSSQLEVDDRVSVSVALLRMAVPVLGLPVLGLLFLGLLFLGMTAIALVAVRLRTGRRDH